MGIPEHSGHLRSDKGTPRRDKRLGDASIQRDVHDFMRFYPFLKF